MTEDQEPINWWKPERCPVTFRKFFMWINHPDMGWVPTYGGPFDSYTIPAPYEGELKKGVKIYDIELYCQRYDHDEGYWLVDENYDEGYRIATDEILCNLPNQTNQ